MNLTLRPCLPTDFETLHRIDRACYEPGIAYSRRTLRSFLALPGSRCWVACIDEEIVGFLIALWDAGHGHLITIDVATSARRQGVGTALLTLAEREMAQSDVRVVELETATNNQAAVAFWTRHGYHIVGLYPRYYLRRIDAYLMTKRLAPPSTEK